MSPATKNGGAYKLDLRGEKKRKLGASGGEGVNQGEVGDGVNIDQKLIKIVVVILQ